MTTFGPEKYLSKIDILKNYFNLIMIKNYQ
jgi:hypothetical protein